MEVTVGEAPTEASVGSLRSGGPIESGNARLTGRSCSQAQSPAGRSGCLPPTSWARSPIGLNFTRTSAASPPNRCVGSMRSSRRSPRPGSWQQVFGLVSEQIVADLIQLGLDLRQPQAFQQPLTKSPEGSYQDIVSSVCEGVPITSPRPLSHPARPSNPVLLRARKNHVLVCKDIGREASPEQSSRRFLLPPLCPGRAVLPGPVTTTPGVVKPAAAPGFAPFASRGTRPSSRVNNDGTYPSSQQQQQPAQPQNSTVLQPSANFSPPCRW